MTITDLDQRLQTRLIKALTELPAAYNQLHLFTLPGSRPNDGSKPRRGTLSTRAPLILDVVALLDERHKSECELTRHCGHNPPCPYNDYDTDRMDGARRLGILPTLSQWVRLADGELWDTGHDHTPPSDTPTVTTECAWLLDQSNWILNQPWIADIVDDLHRMLRDVTLITGTDTNTIKMTCLKLGCGWPVVAMDDGAWYRCTGCGDSRGRLELHRMAERKKPRSLTFIAQFAGLSTRTVLRYIKAKNIRPVAREGTMNLYDLTEVMEATSPERYKTA